MGYVDGEPKTKAGRRKILLSSVVVEAFKEQNAAATANAAPLN